MKLKIRLAAVFLALPIFTFAQNNAKTSFLVAPTISTDVFFSKDKTTIPTGTWTGYTIERRFIGYSAGVMGYVEFNNGLQLGTGLLYTNKDLQAEYYCHVCDLRPQTPQPIPFRYVEIPLRAKYTFGKGNTTFFLEGGVNNSILIREPGNEYPGDGWNVNNFALNGQLGAGVTVKLGERTALSGSVIYRQELTPSFSDNSFRYKSFGFQLMFIYRL